MTMAARQVLSPGATLVLVVVKEAWCRSLLAPDYGTERRRDVVHAMERSRYGKDNCATDPDESNICRQKAEDEEGRLQSIARC